MLLPNKLQVKTEKDVAKQTAKDLNIPEDDVLKIYKLWLKFYGQEVLKKYLVYRVDVPGIGTLKFNYNRAFGTGNITQDDMKRLSLIHI